MSIEEVSLAVPAEQRARFLDRAWRIAERARSGRVSELEWQLSLRVLSVLYGAVKAGERRSES